MVREVALDRKEKQGNSFLELHPNLSRNDPRIQMVSAPQIFKEPPIYFLEQGRRYLSDEEIRYCSRFDRNLGLLSVQGQLLLLHSKVSVAGCGAEGSTIAKRLVQSGVGNLVLADNDVFELSNVNRQEGAGEKTLGLNKAKATANMVKDVNPEINLKILTSGIGEDTIKFLEGSDLIVEEIDYKAPLVVLMVHDFARENRIPTITSISVGFGFRVYYVDYLRKRGMDFREFIGFSDSTGLEEIRERIEEINILKFCPRLPQYISEAVLVAVARGESAPVVTEGVNMGAGYINFLVKEILLGSPEQPRTLPYIYCFDAQTGDFGLVDARTPDGQVSEKIVSFSRKKGKPHA